MSNSLSSLTDLIETRCACILSFFRPFWHTNYIKIIWLVDLIMPKPVFLMTVHEAHMEYNSLIDQILAKYELLDSGEYGSVGTPAFNAECYKLAHLMARMSNYVSIWTCQCPRNFTGPHNSSIELLWILNSLVAGSVRVWRMQLCSHRYVRITGLLSAPLVNVRIGDWLCVLPAITLVVAGPRKLTKLPPRTDQWWTAKPPRRKAHTIAFRPGRDERPLYTEYTFNPFDMSNKLSNSACSVA